MIKPNFLSKNKPLFKERFFITRPNLPKTKELMPYMDAMLKSKWVTNFGKFHNEFADEIKKRLNVKYALPCCNGTIALFMLIEALELKGKVITTPFTFPATIHAVTMAGLEPLFCDINRDEYTIDAEAVEKLITPEVSAILAVNVFGNICDVEKLNELSLKYKIPVIYDSAHAFLASFKGKKVGNFGTAEMFSFHATKFFNTIEGGVITTNDEKLYNKLKLLINFGIKDEENVTGIGLNGKMSEVNAIFGLLSFKKADTYLDKLSNLHKIYKQGLSKIQGIKMQVINSQCSPNRQYMPVEINENEFGLTRDELHLVLKADNLITRKYFYPSADQYECYKNKPFTNNINLINVKAVTKRIMCLPMFASMNPEDSRKICGLIGSVQKHSKEISSILKNK